MRTVYIDILFFVNFAADLLCLIATARIMGRPFRLRRLLIAAGCGGIYASLAFLPALAICYTLVGKLASGILIVLAGFGYREGSVFLRQLLIFFFVSFLFGGAVTALEYALHGGMNADGAYMTASFEILVLALAFCYGLIYLFFQGTGRHGGQILRVSIEHGGHKISLSALMDTGNTLTDPVTGAPVLVAELSALAPLFPARLNDVCTPELLRQPVALLELIGDIEQAPRFRLIPFRTVERGSGWLLAFKPDRMTLADREETEMLVAIAPEQISEGVGYCALAGGRS